jgi:two-component system, sporulation sensor kinase C
LEFAVSAQQERTCSDSNSTDRPFVAAIAAGDDRWFRAVADNTYDWESWHRPDGRLVWVNPAVERLTGYSVAECLEMLDYPLPFVVPEDHASVTSVLTSAQDKTSGEGLDFCIRGRHGQSRWMSLAWQPMYDADGTYLGYRTSARDVTERRALREQLSLHAEHLEQLVQERTERVLQLEVRQRQMEKLVALGQLAAGVAHEINNPLAGMRNAFELIKRSLPPEHEHFELLRLIDKEIDRISGITHQMYQLYKRTPQQSCKFDITQTVSEVLFMLENTADKQKIRLMFDAQQKPVRINLVEGEVKQILYNLIRNAIQASPVGAEVAVRIGQDDREIAVLIEDRGSGIPDEIMPRIFDPFFSTKQVDAQAGMGLGLSVSRSLVEAMGGRIEVTSKLGQGSLFSVILPWRLDAGQEAVDG